MDKDIIDTPMIDPNLDSYKQFFDHKWAERMFKAVETSPLNDPICTLMVAWRSANGSHMLPWLMAHSLKGFAENEGNGSLRFRADYSSEVVKGLVGKLDTRMQYSLKRDQRAALGRGQRQGAARLRGARGRGDVHNVCPGWQHISLRKR